MRWSPASSSSLFVVVWFKGNSATQTHSATYHCDVELERQSKFLASGSVI